MIDQPIDPELTDEIRNGNCVLVLGPDLAEMAGLPSLSTLMEDPAKELGIDSQSLSVPEIAECYVKSHEKAAGLLKRRLKKRLQIQTRHKDNHLLIKDLPFPVIIAMSYDTLLEHAFDAPPSKNFAPVVIENGLSSWDDDVPQIVRPLGSVDDPESIVIATSEFESYPAKYPRIIQKIKTLALERTFLFIGFGGQSHELDWLLESFDSDFQKSGKATHIVITDSALYAGELLERENFRVTVLDLRDKTSPLGMSRFLRCLSDMVKGLTTADVLRPGIGQVIRPPVTLADQEKQTIVNGLIDTRLGSYLSFRVKPKAVDHVHHYEYLGREDLLDYEVGDFYSIRVLKGINMGEGLSAFVIYSESSEVKVTFEDCCIQAIDLTSGDPLVVDPLGDGGLSFTQAFRIYFPCPIAPGERFDIEYCMRLPGELRALPRRGDAMSISLARTVLGVDELEFAVVLDKKPRAYWVDELTYERGRQMSRLRPPIQELGRQYIEERDRHCKALQWTSDKAFRIACKWHKPEAIGYFINYKFG